MLESSGLVPQRLPRAIMGTQKTRLVAQLALVSCLGLGGLVATPAQALGLGAGPASVTLGQPLDLNITARLEAGESLGPECVQAEVFVGDQRPVPATVTLRPAANGNTVAIRVSTSAVIDEPVVTLQLQAGCTSRVSRRYVALADPVGVAVAAPGAALPSPPAAALPLAESLTERPAGASLPATTSEPARAASTAAEVAPTTVRPQVRDTGAQRARAEARVAARAERAAARRAAAAARVRDNAAGPVPAKSAPVAAARTAPTSRLRLDAAELTPVSAGSPEVIEQAIEAVARAASAARDSAAAASAAAERIATLERNLDRTRSDARASQTEVERLRLVLNRPQLSQDWMWPLIALMLVFGLLAAWFAWRLRAMQRTQEVAWARASAVAAADVPNKETSPLPLINSQPPGSAMAHATSPAAASVDERTVSLSPIVAPTMALARTPDPPVDHAMERTAVLPPTARVEETSPRDVSIEELIDIDQQAEFFVALGQDNAAIDMLVAHLRNTGGGSPLTYLKLLEIYRRVGDHDAYERTRTRFNQRYNAYAPQWGADLAHGQSLEDYTAVVPRLTQAWPRPLDAMAELEALLFRKSRGELFDLPAYRDVLFLYALARDLMDREPTDMDQVDFLLPLDAAGRAAHAAGAVGNSRAVSDVHADDLPTAPLDLDLTPVRSQESIFGEPLLPSVKPGRNSR